MTPTWDETNCPPAIASLDPAIRGLALNYANAEITAGRHPDRALSFGIAKALATDESDLGADASGLYVQSADGKWVIFSDASDDRYDFDSYEDALRRATEIAHARSLPILVLTSDGGVVEKWEVAPNSHGDVALHLQPGAGGWIVRGPASQSVFPTKKAGLSAARDQARGLGADLIVHYRDGSVQERHNFV